MPECVITSQEEILKRQQMIEAAHALGSKVMPMITQFCECHGQHHIIRVEGAAVEKNYGATPVDVHMTPEEEKENGIYHHHEYCSTCSSYHAIGACRGSRTRESVGS